MRESSRAKHVSLKITAEGALEVIVPPGFDRRQVPGIVAQKQTWIDRVQQKLALHQSEADPTLVGPYPETVALAALGQVWQVTYRPTRAAGIHLVVHPHCQLLLLGQTQNWELCRHALKQWLVQTAKQQLAAWLARVSDQVGLPYRQVTVRSPKTRWGSCSSNHNISLNSKLLFLRPAVVRYVLVHELSHTIHFDHSPAFWKRVASHEPRYRHLRTELKQGHYLVPHWME